MKHLAAIAFAVAIAFSGHCDAKGSSGHSSSGSYSHPCPSTGRSSGGCPGYVIDHVTPLKRGGADAARNMQWQTKAAAREKDKWE